MAAGLAAALLLAAAPAAAFVDPLDAPAQPSALAARSPLFAVAASGSRIVAAGERGHVLWSEDGGASWTQGAVPVATDLTAVRLLSPERGWAAGHDGVVLRTRDGGRTWERRLDGRRLGPDGSLLDLWFADDRTGWVVGAFGLVLRTDDGGATWTSWKARADNPRGLHLYAVAPGAGGLWMVGEQGLILRLDAAAGRLRAVRAPYAGTFFGLAACRDALLAFGLRGTALRTVDRGATWRAVRTGVQASLVGATLAPGDRLVLVSQDGDLLVSEDCGETFRTAGRVEGRASAVAPAGEGALVVVGLSGARVAPLRRGD
jgi:photosystem II stability/assembly factor-like uncharacterized protein